MALQIQTEPSAAFFDGTASYVNQLAYLQPGAVPQWAGAAANIRTSIRDPYSIGSFSTNATPGVLPAGGPPPTYILSTQHQDYHYRIWVLPNELSLNNPALGVNIPVKLWNTWPTPPTNVYVATTLEDLTGVIVDIAPGVSVDSFQLKDVNLQLTPDAGLKMNGYIRFTFANGDGELHLIVERASIVPVIPDAPVTEKWAWKSQVMVANDGTEQRVSLASAPRKTTDFVLTVIYPDEANAVIKQLFADSASAVILPQYQYLGGLLSAAASGALSIDVPTNRGDLRAGSLIFLRSRDGVSELNTVVSVTAPSTVVLESPLQNAYEIGSWVMPASAMYLNRTTEFERAAADGYAILSTQAANIAVQAPFIRATANVVLDTFGGLPLLNERPVVRGSAVTAVYDSGTSRIDYGGKITLIADWEHTQVSMGRQYLVDRFFNPDVMDWWRAFLDYARGRTKPFYVPSFRPDLVAYTPPAENSATIILDDNRYSSAIYGKTVFDQLAIYTTAGIHYTTVIGVSTDALGKDTITLGTPFPVGADWVDVQKISFLMRCRLDSDSVTWEHYSLHSYLELQIRTTDQ